MRKVNDTPNSPLRFIDDGGKVSGQFYNSWDSKHHLAVYVPYAQPPDKYLCGKTGNFSPSRTDENTRKSSQPICPECHSKLMELTNNIDMWK